MEDFYMIIGNMNELIQYKGILKNLDKAIDWVLANDLINLEVGKYTIDGTNIILNRQQYQCKPYSDCKGETHQKFLDLQIVLKGNEGFGYTNLSNTAFLSVTEEYNPTKDVTKYAMKEECTFNMQAGSFAIVFPQDAHKPQIAIDDSIVEKAVVKIAIE